MPLYSYNGGLLGTPGGLAGDANCCCGGSCQGPCRWQPVWLSGGTWAGGWELLAGCQPATPECTCAEPSVSSVGTETYPYQEYWETPCGPPCTGACDYVWHGEAIGWLGLSPYCSTGCECPGPPGTPGPGDPTYVNLPCIPMSAALMAQYSSEPTAAAGPGTELKAMLGLIGIRSSPTCSCNAHARQMDMWGPDQCASREDEIVGWLRDQAAARKLPFVDFAARQLIRLAIRRARRKAAK